MKRNHIAVYAVSDWFNMLGRRIKRNRVAVILYALSCLLFAVIGIAVGVNMNDKLSYVLKNSAGIFIFLRGDSTAVAFLFTDFSMTFLYAAFCASMFFFRALPILSLAPCLYRSYSIGVQASVIITVFSASSLPMLFVLYIPIGLIEVSFLCIISRRCFEFSALNSRCAPSKSDVIAYYKTYIPFLIVFAVCAIVKTLTLLLFGSALVGVV